MLEFVFTIWLAYVLSSVIRFVLQEDVYPRTGLTRGMSYALSSLLNYIILTLGFLLALGAVGMDLTKMTVQLLAPWRRPRLRHAEHREQLRLGGLLPVRASDPRR